LIWLQLLGVWGWLKKAALSVFSAAVRYPWQTALIVAVVASCWLWRGKESALRERDAARAQIVALVKASDDNRKAAEEQVRQQQAAFDQAAKESQDEYETQLSAYRGRAGTYAASHRLPRLQADCSTATASGQGQNPGLPSDDASRSDYIAVRQDDYDALIENTVRLQAAHDWAKALIVSGIAEPVIPDPALSAH
jgi:hypothetical protein